MNIKQEFSLLRGTQNILDIPQLIINQHSIQHGLKRAYYPIRMEKKLVHFGKEIILSHLSGSKGGRPLFAIVDLPDYLLPVSYNKKTDQIIINIRFFGVDDITATTPDPRNLYSAFVYGYIFYSILKQKIEINKKISPVIISYLFSIFIKVFGKDFGLTSTYTSELPKVKFLISCYILSSFFGLHNGLELYRLSSTIGTFDYRKIEYELHKYNFSEISDFILALSELKAMPGLNKFVFTKKIQTFFGINFIAGLEDLSRFLSVIATATVGGTSIVPTFIATKYNQEDFDKLAMIAKNIFKNDT